MSVNPRLAEELQQRCGYAFTNPDLLLAAMTHSSSADHRKNSNERLEFLGDAVLGLVVCQAVYERLPNALEGDLTKIKSTVVSRRVCARVAEELSLTEPMLLGQGVCHGDVPRSMAAGVFEALVGAIYLDGGLEHARRFILANLSAEIDRASRSEHQSNFNSQLQQFSHRTLNAAPVYELLDEKGPDHSKCFEVAVAIGKQQFASAWGTNKKEAEQKAARAALEALGAVSTNVPHEQAYV